MLNASLSPEERLVKVEQNQDRMAQMLMQIVGYMDQNKTGTITATNNAAGGPPGIPGLGQLPIGEIIKAGLQMFNTPAAPAVDPWLMELNKGMLSAMQEGFKSYVQTINQDAAIGAEVVKAIKAGKLKMVTEEATAATP